MEGRAAAGTPSRNRTAPLNTPDSSSADDDAQSRTATQEGAGSHAAAPSPSQPTRNNLLPLPIFSFAPTNQPLAAGTTSRVSASRPSSPGSGAFVRPRSPSSGPTNSRLDQQNTSPPTAPVSFNPAPTVSSAFQQSIASQVAPTSSSPLPVTGSLTQPTTSSQAAPASRSPVQTAGGMFQLGTTSQTAAASSNATAARNLSTSTPGGIFGQNNASGFTFGGVNSAPTSTNATPSSTVPGGTSLSGSTLNSAPQRQQA